MSAYTLFPLLLVLLVWNLAHPWSQSYVVSYCSQGRGLPRKQLQTILRLYMSAFHSSRMMTRHVSSNIECLMFRSCGLGNVSVLKSHCSSFN